MSDDRCDVAGCPDADQHFPVAQLILPLDLSLASDLMLGIDLACGHHGLQAVVVDRPGHGNGRIYARRLP